MVELSMEEKKRECLELLKYIDRVCRENEIGYFLAYGTLLGAVRHRGFIPWDDDVDIMVPFEQFEKLMTALKANDRGYILYDYTDGNAQSWGSMYSKLDNGTTFCIDELNGARVPGISVDIFPLIFCKGKSVKKLAGCERMNTRMFSFETGRYKNCLKKIVYGIWNRLGNTHKHYLYKFNRLAKDRGNKVYFADLKQETILSAENFETSEMQFAGSAFFVPKQYDKILEVLYGDYMALPPENERVGHNPVFWKEK